MTTATDTQILTHGTGTPIAKRAEPKAAPSTARADWLAGHFTELHATVYRYLLHRVFDPELAEEIAAETFFRAVDAGDKLPSDIDHVRAWLLRVATNAANTRHRRRRLRQKLLGGYWNQKPQCAMPDSPALPDERRRSRVRNAVVALRPKYQTVVALRFYSRMSHRDIAAVLGCSEQAVRTRLSRAISEVRQRVAAEES